ncbi:uncharacterized protein LY89DRAFT_672467 [Mollisia scopiformis]|uniref:Rhodopsin domain-containing protein n=1 Tax=Mollisia scopiformis TaxID=149040 RepID=A0A194X046_MOLSC|nr:uncharacterized protein LY89DRAFT_672467 [Mollisia scopiformis]KUJ13242.1 hypothetical protein LY89DRAFT_672467 [Mollisia scopiformis]
MAYTQSYSPEYLAANRSQRLTNVAIVFGVLEPIFVGLFYISRWKSGTAHRWDVYLMLLALPLCFSHVIVSFLFVRYAGDGHHVVAVPTNEIIIWLKLTVVEDFTYVASCTLPKITILTLYLRIFIEKWQRYSVFVVIGVLLLNYIVSMLLNCVLCRPFAYNWNKTIPGGYCMDIKEMYIWYSLPNIATDIIIIILPLPTIWALRMSRSQKIGVIITLLTGSVGIITAILRLVIFITIDVFQDITWLSIDIMTYTTAEPGVYLIAACLPSLRPLFKGIFKSKNFSIQSLRSLLFKKTRTDGNSYCVPNAGISDNRFHRLDDFTKSAALGDGTGTKATVTYSREMGSEVTPSPSSTKVDLESSCNTTDIRVQRTYCLSSEVGNVERVKARGVGSVLPYSESPCYW